MEWREYSRCKDTNNIIYVQRVLIRPNQTPDSSRYIQWVDELLLISYLSSNQSPPTLLGTFKYESTNKPNQMR